ncbi:glycosyltransferase family 2 protein [Flavobacterium sp. LS1R10]|uniref:glycosyltransferase family 2 protein n=1 Tax=Flavobacterium sp. LS1R10 TaxID=2497482 RepID=UPI000F835DD1|nr:glycosyltransferase family A protein [Flavobacterium sp. LS1R10]RTY76869.1 glycosyltransferase family 2 protein [Flavobacterium sp. LS1R10]
MKKLAVLMPTYNCAKYLQESIDSILNQTYSDFDFYIYDDCSTDNTIQVISGYSDKRIIYIKNFENFGIAKTLNLGFEKLLPSYQYIARMDADDWSFPERFQRQIDYLERNKEVVMCGTQGYCLKNMNDNPISAWEYPFKNDYIKYYLLFSATFHHQSIVFRSEFLIRTHLRYDETIQTCEDWDFWTHIVKEGKVVNLPNFLLKCRVLPNSNHRSPENKNKHIKERSKIISRYWADFNIILSVDEVYEYYYGNKLLSSADFIKKIKFLIIQFNTLYLKELQMDPDDRKKFRYLLARRILSYWKRSTVNRFNPLIWFVIIKEVKFMSKIRLIKSLIR